MDLNNILNLIKGGESAYVEFKQRSTKDIHKEIVALANADGGHILIGIDDDGGIVGVNAKLSMELISNAIQSIIPLPRVLFHQYSIDGRDIIVVEIPKSETLCSIGGVAYIRIGTGIRPLSIQEILILSSEIGTIQWDGAPLLPEAIMNHDFVDMYFNRMEESRGKSIHTQHRNRYFRSIGTLRDDKLTNAGVLFFTDASEHISHCRIRLVFMEKNKPMGSREYTGPVWKLIEDVLADILREAGTLEVVLSARRRIISQYPPRILREGITNAVAHRNYVIPADIRIFLHRNKIVIRSPGGLLPGVDLEDPEHVPRNPSLCNLLYDAGFIERYGFGIHVMKEEAEHHSEVTLSFSAKPHVFEVILERDTEVGLGEMDRKLLDMLNHPMRSSEIAYALGKSKPTVLAHLRKLEEIGLVTKEGRGPHTRYRVRP